VKKKGKEIKDSDFYRLKKIFWSLDYQKLLKET